MVIFSIITASKNSGFDILATKSSLSSQIETRFEWIVVDSSSDTCSRDIINRIQPSIDVLIRDKDESIADAWNLGLDASKGDYVLFLNSGDTYHPAFLHTCALYLDPKVILTFSATITSPSGRPIRLFTPRPHLLWRGMTVPHEWMCIPRNFFHDHGFYSNLRHAMDYEWTFRVYSQLGTSAFKVFNNFSYGKYILGGHSDRYYLQGVLATIRIATTLNKSLLFKTLLFLFYGSLVAFRFLSRATRPLPP